MIQLTECVTGEQMDVKPTKIVAGHEPEKTNLLLQAMFRAATAGIDTAPHVAQVLGAGGEDEDEGEAPGEDDAEARAQAEAEAQERAMQEQEARAAQEAEAKR